MGKFARSVAHLKNVTVDPIATGAKTIGRTIKNTTLHGVEAVREAETEIERDKQRKAREKEMVAKVLSETNKASFRERLAAAKAAFVEDIEEDENVPVEA